MLGLHYVPSGHDNRVSGLGGQNEMDVRKRKGTEWANVTGRGCCECRARLLNWQKFATAVTVWIRNLVYSSKT